MDRPSFLLGTHGVTGSGRWGSGGVGVTNVLEAAKLLSNVLALGRVPAVSGRQCSAPSPPPGAVCSPSAVLASGSRGALRTSPRLNNAEHLFTDLDLSQISGLFNLDFGPIRKSHYVVYVSQRFSIATVTSHHKLSSQSQHRLTSSCRWWPEGWLVGWQQGCFLPAGSGGESASSLTSVAWVSEARPGPL